MKPGRYGPFDYTPITQRPKLVWPSTVVPAFSEVCVVVGAYLGMFVFLYPSWGPSVMSIEA